MKTLRYWLGLPLYNLILWVLCVILVNDILIEHWLLSDALSVCAGFSILTVPFAVSLFYPVERGDCRPLWKPVVISFAAIYIVAQITLTVLIGTFLGATIVAAMLAFAELVGYSIGLLLKDSALRRSEAERALRLTPLRFPNEEEAHGDAEQA